MLSIKIPASTSNLGAGFDVFGLALRLYLNVKVEKCPDPVHNVRFHGEGSEYITHSKGKNFITAALEKIFSDRGLSMPGYRIIAKNEIPVSRGLGSSGTAIIAGVHAANYLGGLNMSDQELLDEAVGIEGHPDNICPSFSGGLTAALQNGNGKTTCIKLKFPKGISLIFVIPEIHVSTNRAREILPGKYGIRDVVFNLQRASLLLESVRRKNYRLISQVLQDRLHQSYRASLIPGLDEILNIKSENGLIGVFLSGSGPTVCAFATHNEENIAHEIAKKFSKNKLFSKFLILRSDNTGTKVKINE